MPSNDEIIKRLDAKLAQIKAQKQRLLARGKQAERKKETRTKILIGSAVLADIKGGHLSKELIKQTLDRQLKRDRDRDLLKDSFGLNATPKVSETPAKKSTIDNEEKLRQRAKELRVASNGIRPSS